MAFCKVQFTHSLYSGVCKQEIMEWDDICNMVKRPIRLKNKQEASLWSFYNMKGQRGEYGRLLGVKDNVLSVIAMQIDYDDGAITIDKFKREFEDFAYLLYTSKSHSSISHRFRVVLPLKYAIDNRIYSSKSTREYLQMLFYGCDKTTFDGWRKQRIPHITEQTKEYVYHINHGKLFELDINLMNDLYEQDVAKQSSYNYTNFNYDAEYMEVDPFTSTLREIYDSTIHNSQVSLLDTLQEKYREKLESISNWYNRGSGEDIHATCRTCIYGLRMNGMDDDDVYNFIMEYAPYKYQKEMHDMCFGRI